ncbi:MAG TPA: 2-amino-4-hydroxy-6-hydroxymethyldihydropteridine diphosphokinase [Gemmatimonadaceae bacterium]|nr:2-amino-4-hydroxy-6-hydroxymethyldihydropteridine diphosphokinase [Gemmatimonadaceae bacterium]
MPTAFIALGSNLGDRDANLRAARDAIAALPDTFIVAASEVEETEPLGGRQQETYLNQMLAVKTALEPMMLLDELLRIEQDNGRERRERWSSRTLDLDIVSYGDVTMSSPRLTLPHPGLRDRDFWQREIAQIEATL